jgi:hypothetical protein
MPTPTAVWLVRRGSPDAIPGRLSLQDGTLRFAGEEATVEIPTREIRRARRRPGAPILQVDYGENTLFLYFAQPPPLPGTVRRRGIGARSLERARAAKQLRMGSRQLKQTIEEWSKVLGEAGTG